MRAYLYGTHLARSKVVPSQTGVAYIYSALVRRRPQSPLRLTRYARKFRLFSLFAYSPLRLNSLILYSRYPPTFSLFVLFYLIVQYTRYLCKYVRQPTWFTELIRPSSTISKSSFGLFLTPKCLIHGRSMHNSPRI